MVHESYKVAAVDLKRHVVNAIANSLTSSGFRKAGNLFKREFGQIIHLIGLQSSTSSTATRAKVTLNLAIWCVPASDTDEKPSIWNAHWRERIGYLMPEHTDKWWVLDSAAASTVAAAEIAMALARFGVPALDRLVSPDALRALWLSGQSPGLTDAQRLRYLARLTR